MKKTYTEYGKTLSGKPIGMNGLQCDEGESFVGYEMIETQSSHQDQITGESTRIVRLKNGSTLRFSMSEDSNRLCKNLDGLPYAYHTIGGLVKLG